jgi:hypothetical protein
MYAITTACLDIFNLKHIQIYLYRILYNTHPWQMLVWDFTVFRERICVSLVVALFRNHQ